MTQGKRIGKIVKFAQRIAGREAHRLAWRGDLTLQHKIAVLKTVRQCLLIPECMPPLIVSLFKERQSDRQTRQSGNLDLVIPRTEMKKASFSYSGAKLWNSLPIHVRNYSKADFVKYILEHHAVK